MFSGAMPMTCPKRCMVSVSWLEAVGLRRGAAQDRIDLGLSAAGQRGVRLGPNFGVITSQNRHGPIAAEEQPTGPELLDGKVDIGLQIGGGPVGPIGGGIEA